MRPTEKTLPRWCWSLEQREDSLSKISAYDLVGKNQAAKINDVINPLSPKSDQQQFFFSIQGMLFEGRNENF